MKAIETAMTEKGFTAERIKEAQVLYTLALYDHSKSDGFVDKLVGCFAGDQTDEQLITAVNAAFGTELKTEDFYKGHDIHPSQGRQHLRLHRSRYQERP